MNINPSAAASVAGTSRAAALGGEAGAQAIESTRQQSTAEKPGGKSADSNAIDAGEQAGDRNGNGRQILDQFEHREESEEQTPDDQVMKGNDLDEAGEQSSVPASEGADDDAPGQYLDLKV